MNQRTQGYSLTKKTEGRKSRETVPLMGFSLKSVKMKQLYQGVLPFELSKAFLHTSRMNQQSGFRFYKLPNRLYLKIR
jgi:hypothetical protein